MAELPVEGLAVPAIEVLAAEPAAALNYRAAFNGRRIAFERPNQAPVHYSAAPLMRPGAITNMLQTVSRRIVMLCPVFVDTFLPVHVRDNAQYICTVAGLVVPELARTSDQSALMTVQACAVGYPLSACGTPMEAFEAVCRGILEKRNSIPAAVLDEISEVAQDGQRVAPAWMTRPGEAIPGPHVAQIISAWARTDAQRGLTVSMFCTALLAFCKQGNMSTNVANKVTQAAREELGINVNLNPNVVRNVWNMIGHWFNHENAQRFFQLWEDAIGGSCLRFRLICQQASWNGMTNYTNIINAKAEFPDFDWAACAQLFGQEFVNFRRAEAAVGDDAFYGYRKDLGDAKSTNFPNLAYTAYALIVNIKGDRAMRDFLGTNRNTTHAAAIDVLIRDYETRRMAAVRNVPGAVAVGHAREFLGADPYVAPPPVQPGGGRGVNNQAVLDLINHMQNMGLNVNEPGEVNDVVPNIPRGRGGRGRGFR